MEGLTGHAHPLTSAEAGARVPVRKWHEKILMEFARAGYDGLTAAEAGQIVGLSTQLAGARFLELRGERRKPGMPKLIERTPQRRAFHGGREGYVHVLTAAGWERALELWDAA